METLMRLNYNILSASSEDTDYPCSDLSKQKNSLGWSSVRFCSFPQELIIQFPSLVHITKISILFHESKIPSKLNVSSFFPQSTKDFYLNYKQLSFESIGFIQPDTNERSNYQSRELRKIIIDIKSYYIKLLLEKNYHNKHNTFHQVALISIDFFGFPLNGGPDYVKVDYSKGITDHVYDDDIKEICGELVVYIGRKMDLAQQEKRYEDLKVISNLLGEVKDIGKKIYTLESKKILAIKAEDFDAAKRLKMEADSYREQLERIALKKENLAQYQREGDGNENVVQLGDKGSLKYDVTSNEPLKETETKLEEAWRLHKGHEDYLNELTNERYILFI